MSTTSAHKSVLLTRNPLQEVQQEVKVPSQLWVHLEFACRWAEWSTLQRISHTTKFYCEWPVNVKKKLVKIVQKVKDSLKLGASCLELGIWCPFLQTIADKKCKKGDIVRWVQGQGQSEPESKEANFLSCYRRISGVLLGGSGKPRLKKLVPALLSKELV